MPSLPLPRALRLRKVKWKIMLPFVLLTGMFAVFATRNVTELVTSSLEERLAAQLTSASQRTADELAKRERDNLEAARTVAFTTGVADATRAGDASALQPLVVPQLVNSGTQRLAIYGLDGRLVFGVRQAADGSLASLSPEAPAPGSPVDRVLRGERDERGDKWAAVDPTDGGRLLTASPITDESGALVGAVEVSSPLAPLLLSVKANSVAEVTLAESDGTVWTSTFDAAAANAPRPNAERGRVVPGTVLGRDYEFLSAPLLVRGEDVGTVSVAVPRQAVSSTSGEARLRMSVIYTAITLAAIAICWLLARLLTGPLGRLMAAARAVADGDLSARSNVRTSDEIGVLGESFDAMAGKLERQHLATIGALASAIDARDPYTAGHSVRVGDLSSELGQGLGLPKPALHHLRVGGLLHDIGKIGVRDTVLLKPGPLTAEERRLIEQHPTIGLQILESAELPKEVLAIVGGHHERLDGSGYPLGLSAEDISVFPRITAVADVYDALTTDRPYRAGMTVEQALAIVLKEAEAGQMDPEVVATMQRIASLWEERRKSAGVQGKAWIESLYALGRAA
jgi:putative nucleotidyltransferase with HDIG domain